MKALKLILGLALITGSLSAHALEETVISRKIVNLPVDLSKAGVRSSNKGYGTTYLVKILVPGLAAETVLNHRNEGESAPCLATYEAFEVEEVIKGNPAIETFAFEIIQKKNFSPDVENKVCNLWLTEEVQAEVRGFKFVHSRSTELPQRHIDDCK